ncbi:MAG: phosphate propanoyltransferase [Clostridia bacterium]|nr:phosphate propanoyltransferase [Clostridia bacterium]
MDKKLIEEIVGKVIQNLKNTKGTIPVEASGRHIHLSKEDAITLFGTTQLTIQRELSQPGQYLYKEKAMLMGPKGILKDVAILGPCRGKTQVELSITDARSIGVKPVVKDSGDLNGASDIIIAANGKVVEGHGTTIIARRHLHMRPEDALTFEVSDGEIVAVRVYGSRQTVFEEVLVRVSPSYSLSLHLDYDEANAVGLLKDSRGEIVK